MTDNGYNVFWNEPTLDGLPQGKAERRHFVSEVGAREFAATLPEEFKPRVYEAAHSSDEQFDTVGRDNADVLNRRLLVELMLKHNITIPAKQFDKWRPTEQKTGRIEGVSDGLTCIMTDGLLGYFLREGKQPLYGHVEWFKWDEPITSFVPYLDEHGQEKYFKQVIDHGAPPAYFKRPKKLGPPREKKARKPKVRVPMTSNAALDLIAQMTAQMNGGTNK